MELKALYPSFVHSLSYDGYITTKDSYKVMQILKLSLLHGCSLTDIFGLTNIKQLVEVNWILWSYNYELTYKIRQSGDQFNSTHTLWTISIWLEREVWEMFGVTFNENHDLRRLLTDYGFQGYPMLKNYPVTGYTQVYYSEKNKRITSVPVFLVQEFREFNYKSPWVE